MRFLATLFLACAPVFAAAIHEEVDKVAADLKIFFSHEGCPLPRTCEGKRFNEYYVAKEEGISNIRLFGFEKERLKESEYCLPVSKDLGLRQIDGTWFMESPLSKTLKEKLILLDIIAFNLECNLDIYTKGTPLASGEIPLTLFHRFEKKPNTRTMYATVDIEAETFNVLAPEEDMERNVQATEFQQTQMQKTIEWLQAQVGIERADELLGFNQENSLEAKF